MEVPFIKQGKMRTFRFIFIIVSVILLFIILCAIINCEISYKYEIEGRNGDKVDILWVAEYLSELVKVWVYFLSYVLINVIYLSISIINNRKNKDCKLTDDK